MCLKQDRKGKVFKYCQQQSCCIFQITCKHSWEHKVLRPPHDTVHSVMLYKQTEFTRFMGLYQSVCNIVVDCLNHWTTGNTNVNVGDITFLQRTDMFNLYIRLGWNLLEESKENLAGNVPKSQQNNPIFWLENVATSKIFISLMVTNAETQAWAVVTGWQSSRYSTMASISSHETDNLNSFWLVNMLWLTCSNLYLCFKET